MLAGARILTAAKVLPPRGWVCPRRVLAEHLLLTIGRGRGELAAGDSVLPLRSNRLYLVRAGVPHLLSADAGQVLEHWALHFVLVDAGGEPLAPDALPLPDTLSLPIRGALEREFLRCVQYASQRSPAAQAALLASFFALLEHLLQGVEGGAQDSVLPARRAEVNARRTGHVMDAIELMMRHVCDDVSLEELSAHVDMSPAHFEKVFKRITGSSPHAYYLGLKMERAKALMAGSGCRLGEIASQLGFASLHHFSRTFKQYEGEPPSAYAQRVRG